MTDPVRAIADAVLYEGYLLWPYTRSALKNQRRWTWGGVFPPAHAREHPDDPCSMRAQVLLEGEPDDVEVTVRFLHVVRRDDGWEEAVERSFGPGAIAVAAGDGREALAGRLSVTVETVGGRRRVTAAVHNETPWEGGARQDALARTFCSTHLILRTRRGAFVSAYDAGDACACVGCWPVRVGEDDRTVLASPIILEDHPRIAPESPGDLFDGGEIDGLLALNILALTDAEKAEMRDTDPRARAILERTEGLTREQLLRLSGYRIERSGDEPRSARQSMSAWEELERPAPDAVTVDGVELRRASRVRLRPRAGGDVLDLALGGRSGVIEGIEQDLDGRLLLAVVVDDDPGRDLGVRRQPGHRFFFAPEEVEPERSGDERAARGRDEGSEAETAGARVLVAGIGNVFLGDDGFGVALAGRLARRALPAGVEVVDYGIRGMDLAYALLDGWDAAILLDAAPRGERPGTLTVIEPDVAAIDVAPEGHGMDPVKVLALVAALGGTPPRTLVLACEPLTVMDEDSEEIVATLSEPVRAALDEAERLLDALLEDLMSPGQGGTS